MKKFNKALYTILGASLMLVSCSQLETDLYVENLEAPNDLTLASDPVALEATAAGLYRGFFLTTNSYYGPALALNVMGDTGSCSWGNAGMRDLSEQPRIPFNNTAGYGNNVTRSYFNGLYTTLSDANTILFALSNGVQFSDNIMIESVARFTQALAIGYNALVFDRVWLSDETGPLNDGVAANYEDAMSQALDMLDLAIAKASSADFTLPADYFSTPMSSSQLVALMNSYGARMSAMNARNATEKQSTDWDRVKTYASNGVTSDFSIENDDVNWWDDFLTYAIYPGWSRIDMRVVNMLDPQMPQMWDDPELVKLPEATSPDARLATDFGYLDSQNFRPERGIYHYSNYRYRRYDNYINEWTVPTPEVGLEETRLYLAEAELWLNNVSVAAGIVNAGTRTTRGELDPVSSASDIYEAIHYERMVEFPMLSMGLSFFDMRGRDLLQPGTLLHFPIPGAALESIPEDYYTYGGSIGTPGVDISNGGW